jgi:hypothetical protein
MHRHLPWLAALVIAGAAILYWQTRERPAPAEPTAPVAAIRPAVTPSSSSAPPALSLPPPPAPPEPGSEPPPELGAMLDDARAHLIAAATPCWTARPAVEAPPDRPDATMGELRFRYTLITDGSEARVDELAITADTIADRTLRDCVERALRGGRWRSDVAAARTPVIDRLRVGELTRREPPQEH